MAVNSSAGTNPRRLSIQSEPDVRIQIPKMAPNIMGHKRFRGLVGFPYIALSRQLLFCPEFDIGRPVADFNGFGAPINIF